MYVAVRSRRGSLHKVYILNQNQQFIFKLRYYEVWIRIESLNNEQNDELDLKRLNNIMTSLSGLCSSLCL